MLALLLALLVGGLHPQVPTQTATSCPAASAPARARAWWDAKSALDVVLSKCSLADPAVQRALIERYRAENADPKWFERAEIDDFTVYDGELGEAVQKIASLYHVPAAFRASIRANFNEDSTCGLWLARSPEALP